MGITDFIGITMKHFSERKEEMIEQKLMCARMCFVLLWTVLTCDPLCTC